MFIRPTRLGRAVAAFVALAAAGMTASGASEQAPPAAADAIKIPFETYTLPNGLTVITSIDPNSDAAEKGIRRGDVILSVNRQAVTSPTQVQAAVETARRAGRSSVLLLVKRGQAPEAFVGVNISAQ